MLAAGILIVLLGCKLGVQTLSPEPKRSTSGSAALTAGILETLSALSSEGKQKLPDFLSDVGLGELLALKELGGSQKLSEKLCVRLLAKYYANQPSTLFPIDGSVFCTVPPEIDFQPLTVFFGEFSNKYLLLTVRLEGLCGPPLFMYAYDLESNGTIEIDASEVPCAQDIRYGDNTLYFFPVKDKGLMRELQATYDLQTQQLNILRSGAYD